MVVEFTVEIIRAVSSVAKEFEVRELLFTVLAHPRTVACHMLIDCIKEVIITIITWSGISGHLKTVTTDWLTAVMSLCGEVIGSISVMSRLFLVLCVCKVNLASSMLSLDTRLKPVAIVKTSTCIARPKTISEVMTTF